MNFQPVKPSRPAIAALREIEKTKKPAPALISHLSVSIFPAAAMHARHSPPPFQKRKAAAHALHWEIKMALSLPILSGRLRSPEETPGIAERDREREKEEQSCPYIYAFK